MTIYSWVGAATRYLLLKRGVVGNTKISRIEEEVLQGEVVVKAESAERHHAMVNFGELLSLVSSVRCSGYGPAGPREAGRW